MLGEKKIIRGISSLGRKASNSVTKLGNKTHDVLNKIENGVNRVDNIATNSIDKAADIGQKIVNKSGQVTNALRAGSNIANSIAGVADNLGVPGASLAHAATRQLANGAQIIDQKRDSIANKIESARQTAQLEKQNLRKKIDEQQNNLRDQVSNFV